MAIEDSNICDSRLREIVQNNEFVLVLIYDSRIPKSRYLSELIDDISYSLKPVIHVVKVDKANVPQFVEKYAPTLPRLLLFYRGSKIWEQIGFFYNPISDKKAIRRGLLHALRSQGYTPSSLGIRLG